VIGIVMVCEFEDCRAEFERPLVLKTQEQVRIVCPKCKRPGPQFVEGLRDMHFDVGLK